MKPLSAQMLAALTHLKAVKSRQAAEAKYSKKRNLKGWTYRPHRFAERTFVAMWKRGLIESCCAGHEGRDLVRITPLGESRLPS